MKNAEGIDDMAINLQEDGFINLNNSNFRNMDLQWFAEETETTTEEVVETTETEEVEDQQQTTELSGLWQGATAEQREQHADYLKDFQKLPEFLEAHMALRKKAEGTTAKPGEGATAEEVAAYKQSLGIPLKAEEYELGEMPEGVQKDEDLETWFKTSALETNLSGEQAKSLYGLWNKLVTERVEAVVQARAEAKKTVETELRQEYGKDYDLNISMAKRIMNLGGKDLWDYLEETGLGSDPRMFKAFAEFGKLISEDSLDSLPVGRGNPTKESPENILYPEK